MVKYLPYPNFTTRELGHNCCKDYYISKRLWRIPWLNSCTILAENFWRSGLAKNVLMAVTLN